MRSRLTAADELKRLDTMKIRIMPAKHIRKSGILLLLLMLASGETKCENLYAANSAGRSRGQNMQQIIDDEDQEYPEEGSVGTPSSPGWKRETISTTSSADFMTPAERNVVIEINLMRRDPARYAQKYLVPLRPYYQGRLLRYPGKIPIMTNEGISALEECIRELERARPVSSLSPSKGLTLAARDHTHDQGRTGSTGHSGSDGSSSINRIDRYGKWNKCAGENISYGYNDARKIIAALLIDDGVPSRGHRKNLLDNNFNHVGVDIGPHRVYGEMCVMDFAGGYTSK
jgi:uncharacterized protein YkwD